MRKLGIVLVVLACMSLLFSAPAMAMNWSIGGNLGYEMLMPTEKDADNVNVFGWPMAGLRVGFVGEQPMHEVYLLSAVSVESASGASFSTYGITGNYQYNFTSKGPVTPYVTAGAGIQGFNLSNDESVGAMSLMFGGGAGVSKKLGAQGTLRAEVRFDRNMEGKDGDAVVIGEANHISLRLGFDLWGK